MNINLAWSRRAKIIASLAVVFQLLAVVAEPLRFFSFGATRGSSPAMDPVRTVLAPYVEFAYLNHGYFFFAPEPGPSHLMQCTLQLPNDEVSLIRFPDKKAQWPRLLYHRHFMFSEFLNQIHAPPVEPTWVLEAPVSEANAWSTNRARYELVRDSMQKHLAVRYGAKSARMDRVRHILPGSDPVLKEGMSLNDPSFYIVLPDSLDGPLASPGPGAQPMVPTPLAPWSLEPRPTPYQLDAPAVVPWQSSARQAESTYRLDAPARASERTVEPIEAPK